MSELRKDSLVDRWVIIAENRAARPIEVTEAPAPRTERACEFCEGREAATPGETLAFRAPGWPADGPGWRVRVIPNKYPALWLPGEPLEPATGSPLFQRAAGDGIHEVIVESPRHLTASAEQTPSELTEVLTAYRQRMQALRAAGLVRQVLVFKNVGAAAGASLAHLHSQLLGLAQVPRAMADELAGAADYLAARSACAFCDLIAAERAGGERVVLDTGDFLLICPWASRLAYELCLLPCRHASHFELDEQSSLPRLGELLQRCLAHLENSLGLRAYNLWLHSAPFDSTGYDHYHWHIEILPRATRIAGLEWGAGLYVNPVPPEQAAERLRAVLV